MSFFVIFLKCNLELFYKYATINFIISKTLDILSYILL